MYRLCVYPLFLLLALSAPAQVNLTQKAESISVNIDGEPFTNFVVAGDSVRKPYLHPIRTASGKAVTRHYPMEIVEGESSDHPHHRGLWFAHGDVNGIDFWSSDPSRTGDQYGAITLTKVVEVKSGKQSGSLIAEFDWKDAAGKTILTERRTMTFAQPGKVRTIDFDILLTAVQNAHFGDTKEGTFAVRVADSMSEQRGGTLVNADLSSGEKAVWGKRSPWVDYFGDVDGETVGIAVLDHPKNPKHPTFWHARAYGLLAANIFGEHDFFGDESRDGGMSLEKGANWRFQYRVVIHSGDTKEAGIDSLSREYARGQ